ncbi:MAG: hypothetical protein M0R46_12905 [Candidatus Muirbacterium halophilum]|nr:hypothetical protein [Candidatus Muirbacterium halophilum]MCK9476818.1 hypothetical protein [Candidatus Muirbacterium halophilum]
MTLNCENIKDKIKNNEILTSEEISHIEKCEYCKKTLSNSEFLISYSLDILKKETSKKDFNIDINKNIMKTIKEKTLKRIRPLSLKLIVVSIFLLIPFVLYNNFINKTQKFEDENFFKRQLSWDIISKNGKIDILKQQENMLKVKTFDESECLIQNSYSSRFLFNSNTSFEIRDNTIFLTEGSFNISVTQPEKVMIDLAGISIDVFDSNAYFEVNSNEILIYIFEGNINSIIKNHMLNFEPMTGFEIKKSDFNSIKNFKITNNFIDRFYKQL